ncbi:DsbA family oxidoreductase [Novosphingobium sp. BL-8A]|uniref:DsbA family oxidoreductase n=1 Tax=Novosphingobium sp. BL-8A TaxID=3127639 RepID=UPI003757B3B4
MSQHLKIDFVSDISCPWCVIGLGGLEQALANLDGTVEADIHFQPFELNPDMGSEGQDIGEHIAQKYGTTPEQSAANREMIRQRAADVGFTMTMAPGSRIYNTFDAHRLLHWADAEGSQKALKKALFEAYFTRGEDVSSRDVLIGAVERAGLDTARAAQILSGDEFADDVRRDEDLWRSRGINSVPAVIVNDRYLISGGQPAEHFEQALRQIAQSAAA